jgi:hypothetical protein
MAALSVAALTTQANTNLADNTAGDISALDVRDMVIDLADSLANLTDLSANQAATGSGDFVLKTSPTLTTPVLGVATATSINKVAITAPAASATLTIANGKTLTASNTLTFTGTDASSVAFGTGGTVVYTSGYAANVATFLATPSSANLIAAVTDETGTGALVFANTPTLVTPLLGTPTSGTLTNCTGLPAAGVVGTAAILGANTFTALQTITQASANAGIIASTGYSLTGSDATSMVSLSGTLNTSGNPDVFKISLAYTAAGAGTNMFRIIREDGPYTLFKVDYTGATTILGVLNGTTASFTSIVEMDSYLVVDQNAGGQPLYWGSGTDACIRKSATSTLTVGPANGAAPAAFTLATQGSRAGTDSNVGGGSLTIQPGIGTGTGTPSNLVLNGIVGTTTGTGTQAVSAGLTIAGCATGQVPSVVCGSAAIATNATDGFLYIPTCAGTPTGTPTAQTGRVPIVFDTTNNKLYIYDGSWLGGTTPGAFV